MYFWRKSWMVWGIGRRRFDERAQLVDECRDQDQRHGDEDEHADECDDDRRDDPAAPHFFQPVRDRVQKIGHGGPGDERQDHVAKGPHEDAKDKRTNAPPAQLFRNGKRH